MTFCYHSFTARTLVLRSMLLMRRSIAPVVQILIVARAVTTVEVMPGPEAVKMLWAKHSAVSGPPKVDREVGWLFPYGPKSRVTVLEQVSVPASHT